MALDVMIRKGFTQTGHVRTFRIAIVALVAVISLGRPASAQSLSFSILERYLDSLREQARIPGLSAAVVQNGSRVWDHGFGKQDVEANVVASPTRPTSSLICRKRSARLFC